MIPAAAITVDAAVMPTDLAGPPQPVAEGWCPKIAASSAAHCCLVAAAAVPTAYPPAAAQTPGVVVVMMVMMVMGDTQAT